MRDDAIWILNWLLILLCYVTWRETHISGSCLIYCVTLCYHHMLCCDIFLSESCHDQINLERSVVNFKFKFQLNVLLNHEHWTENVRSGIFNSKACGPRDRGLGLHRGPGLVRAEGGTGPPSPPSSESAGPPSPPAARNWPTGAAVLAPTSQASS